MPLEPTLEPKPSPEQQPASNQSTVDVTGAYQPEAATTLPHAAAGAVAMDAPTIPGYIITSELARGGMGRVLAGRELALDREVAIKTLLPRADASRFITEAKITAKLPHPSIPPVHALGTLSDGSPFLAMKLVRGKTLAEELKARPHPLHDLPRFLQIFEQIAQAVGFAHSQGIIHRDLKPANVMVGAFGEVQVMDWGLAKDVGATASALRHRGEAAIDATLPRSDEAITLPSAATIPYETPNQQGDQTRSGAVMGTPNYMAPEQARGEVVDARADVFALGGILCAMLTGKAVFGGTTVVETVQQAAAGDTAEALSRLEASGADREVVTLAKQCLAVVASDRPADGQAVAGLVAEYRHGVEARLKQAETERTRAETQAAEQTKRRRIIQWSAVAVAAVLLIGLGVSLWQMNRAIDAEEQAKFNEQQARDERDAKDVALKQAEENLGFAKKGNDILGSVFANLDPKAKYETLGEFRNALKANLQKAVQELEGSAIGDPLVVAEMQIKLGVCLMGLGEFEQAIKLFTLSRDTRKSKLGADHPDTLISMHNLAAGYHDAGQYAKALPLFEETLKLRKAKLGADHPDTLKSMHNLAVGYQNVGQLVKAIPLYEETLKLQKAILGPNHSDTLSSMGSLAEGYSAIGQFAKALPLFEETLKLRKAKLGSNDPETLNSMRSLAACYRDIGQFAKALPLYEETLKLQKAILGTGHSGTLSSMGSLAVVYKATGQFDKALTLLEETLMLEKAKLGADHPHILASMNNLATVYQDVKQIDKALPLLEDVLRLTKAKMGADHPNTLYIINNLAQGYQDAGRLDLALPLQEDALKLMKAKLGADHPHTLTSMNNLASVYKDTGQLAKALPVYEDTLKLMKVKLGADHPNTLTCSSNLAICYKAVGQLDKALLLYQETLRLRKAKLGVDHPDTLMSISNLAVAYNAAGQFDKGLLLLHQYLALSRKTYPKDSPQLAQALANTGMAFLETKYFAETEPLLRECLAIREKKEPDAWTTFNTMSLLGGALLGQKKYAEAEPLLLKGYEGMNQREKTIRPQGKPRIPEALDRLIQLYTETNKPDEVKKWQAEKDKLPRKVTDRKNP